MADEEAAEVSSKVGENFNEGVDNEQSGAAENLVVDATGSTKKEQPIAKQKIDLLLKATGDAPIMKQRKWAVEADRQIGSITIFMKKYLKMEPHESLFLYINQAFAPSPDQILRNLYECFGTDGKLVLHYCKSQAWG